MTKSQFKTLDLVQASALDKLQQLRAGALFMQMGTGKTKVAVELALAKLDYIDKVVWIAPASLVREPSYVDEIKRWAGDYFGIFELYTSEGISMSDNKYLELYSLLSNHRCFGVVDESIKFKNIGSRRTERLLALRDLFEFRLILNGTPTTKNVLDLLPQINFISPKILNMTEAQFANHFMEYYNDGRQAWRRWSRPANEEALVEIVRPYIFDANLDIPTKLHVRTIECELSIDELERYQLEKDDYFSRLVSIDFLAMVQKFQHLYTINGDKFAKLKKCLPSQAVIFCKFLDEVYNLLATLPAAAEYTGRAKADIGEFKAGKIKYLVCTYGTGSLGLNLQFCNNVIFYSQTFDYKDKIQALHRVYRTGQTKDVTVYDFYTNTGLESIIRASLEKKESTLENIKKIIEKEGVKAL